MKTNVKSIMVWKDGVQEDVRIVSGKATLKWNFLRKLLKKGVVVPSEEINKILLDVLDQHKKQSENAKVESKMLLGAISELAAEMDAAGLDPKPILDKYWLEELDDDSEDATEEGSNGGNSFSQSGHDSFDALGIKEELDDMTRY